MCTGVFKCALHAPWGMSSTDVTVQRELETDHAEKELARLSQNGGGVSGRNEDWRALRALFSLTRSWTCPSDHRGVAV